MTTEPTPPVVHSSGTFTIGGDLPVHRLGFGAMRITGPGIWGEPADRAGAIALLRRAVELGVDFIDTADSYGPFVSEDLIREALHPYAGVVIATKGGLTRQGPDRWAPVGSPYYLRQCVEMSLRRLGVECIDLYQLHRIDTGVHLEDQLGALKKLQEQGKIRHLGLSQVSVDELAAAREIIEVTTVQNLYNLGDRHAEDVLEVCAGDGIGFIPWFPVAAGPLARPDGPLAGIVARTGIPAAQLSLAWLLRRSPVMLPIPGTSSIAHLEQNCGAAAVTLDDATYADLSQLGDDEA
ncbi:MAG: aldo/keto reductase [Candidatus Nanopelagicales bacterium]|jgi:aryl-alcohol dehydrogenase-like predicted oxidoreductase|nr:aldo/keto reductase [Candidatus Nanopelagicales bacterium]